MYCVPRYPETDHRSLCPVKKTAMSTGVGLNSTSYRQELRDEIARLQELIQTLYARIKELKEEE